eukprot:TRINITY_DN7189_c0_g1_i3.p1 TRINITY_DN7189_c0_g1~~TRINITY_DN7189_c0_g1_i3.p1  ORF type:complete len:167 (-),score=14.20 TRINITY_DN7189_c0_g1_i3:24-524(-)
MLRYLKNNEKKVVEELKEKGFSEKDVKKAFKAISKLNREEAVLKNPRKSQTALGELISESLVCTYIMKETLRYILDSWTRGRMGRISRNNIHTYREVYQDFYRQTLNLLRSCVNLVTLFAFYYFYQSILVTSLGDKSYLIIQGLSLIHICRCRRLLTCRSRWSPYH